MKAQAKEINAEIDNGNKDDHNGIVQSTPLTLLSQKPANIFEASKSEEYSQVKHPTNYAETLMHLFKGNVGPGIFAMGDAFKNSGLVLGSVLVPLLGLVCLHCEHLLVNASNHVKQRFNMRRNPDFAKTAELCFATSPSVLKNWAPYVRISINLFLCLTQLGFCCVYFVFISSNIKQIMDHYGVVFSIHSHMAFVLLPILLSCVVRNLKYLAWLSTIANICVLYGIVVTLYYSCQRPFAEVENVATLEQLPLFFGTALYAFEGIGLVLPLQNEMKKPTQFNSPFGVLNVGLTTVIVCFSLIGIFSYLQYGQNILGSVTLNLPKDQLLAQSVKIAISLGVLLTFALQFYIPISIMFPVVQKRFGPFKNPTLVEIAFRVFFVLVTFTLAEIVPFLDLFISLVGAFCSSSIALIFPPVLELIAKSSSSEISVWIVAKNGFIVVIGLLGCVTGSYESIKLISQAFKDRPS